DVVVPAAARLDRAGEGRAGAGAELEGGVETAGERGVTEVAELGAHLVAVEGRVAGRGLDRLGARPGGELGVEHARRRLQPAGELLELTAERRGPLGDRGVVAGDVAEDVGTPPERPLRVVPGIAELGEVEPLVRHQPPGHPQVGARAGVERVRLDRLQVGPERVELGEAPGHRRLAGVGEDPVEAVVAAPPGRRGIGREDPGDGALEERGEAIVHLGGHGRGSVPGSASGQRLHWPVVDAQLRARLAAIVGPRSVNARLDAVSPRSTAEVAAVCRACAELGTPISVVSGAVTDPAPGGRAISVSLGRLDQVRVDPGAMVVRAGAGATLVSLRVAVDGARMALIGLPGAGPAAVHAGSLVARGQSGGGVLKDVTGYDLAGALLGSMGRLALVTEVIFRLEPQEARTAAAGAPGGAVGATSDLLRRAFDPDGLMVAAR
ncbi:MAG: FAD-binding oxidoreductase, partial [Chloroflexi bacterium]